MKLNYENKGSNSIFHFTTIQIALEYILPNNKLRLNSIVNTNDPRENKSFGFGAENSNYRGDEHAIEDHTKSDLKVTNDIRKGVKVLCFSQDYKHKQEWYDGYNLPRMWAQYAGNHKGVCLEIDKDIFLEENKKCIGEAYFKNIKYCNENEYPWIDFSRLKTLGYNNYITEFRQKHLDYLFFTKSIDWEAERELRLLKISKQAQKVEFVSIKKSLKNVIVGIDFNEVYLPSMVALIPEKKISRIILNSGDLKSFEYKDEYLKNLCLKK